jgi:hypothetical protein
MAETSPGLWPLFKRRDLADDKALTLPRMEWQVESYSWSTLGGPDRAQLKADASPEALASLLQLLRCPVEIYDRRGELVWYGLAYEVEARQGAISMKMSLDALANKIRIVYTKQTSLLNGAGEGTVTDWSSSAASIAEYGTRERQLSLADATPAQAVAYRNAALADLANPVPQHGEASGGSGVTVNCRGWMETVGWKKYAQDPGTTASENEPTTIQKIGRASYTAATVSFADVSGEWQINDSANGLTTWQAGDYITISGTALNDMQTRVLSVADDGSQLIVSDSTDNEAAGASVTIAPSYTKAAQSFILEDYGEDYFVHTLRLQARVLADGTSTLPGDNLQVSICADNAGEPGATLTSGHISAASMSGDDTGEQWYEWNLDEMTSAWSPAYELSPLTTYWFVVERTGADAEACYQLAIDEAVEYLSGVCKVWDGATWVAFPGPGADIPFVFIGAWRVEKQIERLIAEAEFIASVTIEDASGQYSYPYRDGENDALAVLKQLLRSGVSGGRRYLAEVKPDRSLRIYQEPESAGNKDLQRALSGEYLTHGDRLIEPHRLREIVGEWVRLPPELVDTAASAQLILPSPYFADRAEWSRGSGGRGAVRVTPRNVRSLWDSSVPE